MGICSHLIDQKLNIPEFAGHFEQLLFTFQLFVCDFLLLLLLLFVFAFFVCLFFLLFSSYSMVLSLFLFCFVLFGCFFY